MDEEPVTLFAVNNRPTPVITAHRSAPAISDKTFTAQNLAVPEDICPMTDTGRIAYP